MCVRRQGERLVGLEGMITCKKKNKEKSKKREREMGDDWLVIVFIAVTIMASVTY